MKARIVQNCIALAGLALLASGCGAAAAEAFGAPFADESSSGSVQGRVLNGGAAPVAGARVYLEHPSGPTTISQPDGGFRIGGARSGNTPLFVYDPASDSAAFTWVDLKTSSINVGDLLLEPCVVILSNPDPGPSAATACTDNPPAPSPSADTDYGSLEFEYAFAERDASGLFVDVTAHPVDDIFHTLILNVSIPSSELGSGGFSGNVSYDYNGQSGTIFVTLYDELLGATFVLASGYLDYQVFDDGLNNGQSDFNFYADSLVFDYIDPNTTSADDSFQATVDDVDAYGVEKNNS